MTMIIAIDMVIISNNLIIFKNCNQLINVISVKFNYEFKKKYCGKFRSEMFDKIFQFSSSKREVMSFDQGHLHAALHYRTNRYFDEHFVSSIQKNMSCCNTLMTNNIFKYPF